MCALFGFLDYGHRFPTKILQRLVQALANASEIRGDHASGIAYMKGGSLTIYKRPKPAHKLHFKLPRGTSAVMGHTRFTTQGSEKVNCNNHPFRGHAGTDFALAHNGVLYNDRELRREKHLPETQIETDSYIAVQLLEAQNELSFESLKQMAEDVCGSCTFTILDTENALWFVKGSSPLYLVHFPEFGLYAYASTKEIMQSALKRTILQYMRRDVIAVDEGQILRIDAKGQTACGRFDPFVLAKEFEWELSYCDDELEQLLNICGCFGVTEDEVLQMLEMGYTYDDIEEWLFCPTAYKRALLEGEL